MPSSRRRFLAGLPVLVPAVPATFAQPSSRMTPVAAAQRQQVQVGAGTQSGATTGSSGPQQGSQGDAAAAGSLGSTNPGTGDGGSSPRGRGAPAKGGR